MRCVGELKGMSLNWQTKRPEVTLEVNALPEDVEKLKGKKLTVDLKQYRQRRSLDANAYYWLLVGKIAKATASPSARIHNEMLRRYGQIELLDGKAVYLVIPDTEAATRRAGDAETYHIKPTAQVKLGKDGQMYRTYMMLRGSHEYNTEEMARLIDGIVSEARELGIETMTPDEQQRMMAAFEKNFKKGNQV